VHMAKWRGPVRTVGVVVAALLIAAVNVALFTWLYAPVMLAFEFTVFVFVFLAASIIRSACRDRNVVS
jgi:membrane glycosyltransferase